MKIINRLLDIILPVECLICGKILRHGRVCISCLPQISSAAALQAACKKCWMPSEDAVCKVCINLPLPYRSIRCLWNYNTPQVRHFVTTMKYRPSPYMCRLAGQILNTFNKQSASDMVWDLLVPIPSAKQSLRSRLFNQCLTMAKEFEHPPLSYSALSHRGYPFTQASLSHKKRLQNVRNAFMVNKQEIKGKKLLLLDDVVTTGATTAAASYNLLSAGAYSVDVIALARAQSWIEYRWATYQFYGRV